MKNCACFVILLIFLLFIGNAQAAINISEKPLFLSSEVSPNVMVLLDNSGSMDEIVWAPEYDPNETYPSWAYKCSSNSRNFRDRDFRRENGEECYFNGINNPQSVVYSHTDYGDRTYSGVYPSRVCPNDYILGRKVEVVNNGSGVIKTTKCLRLPSPAELDGHDTRFSVNYINYLFQTFGQNPRVTNGSNCASSSYNYRVESLCRTYPEVDLRNKNIPQKTRMQTARDVAKNIVRDNDKLSFGLAKFNEPSTVNGRYEGAHGGKVVAGCGSRQEELIEEINNVTADSNTPLGETFYEITRYFRGMPSYYNSLEYESPIKYKCQKNFVIVITDGLATFDATYPDNDPDGQGQLPNWDGLSPRTRISDAPNFPKNSDGFAPSGEEGMEGYAIFLDDMAQFGYDTNMSSKKTNLFKDNSEKNNIITYTIGFSTDNQSLIDAARKGGGEYYIAGNEDKLSQSLENAIKEIESKNASASSIATNSTRLEKGTVVYQASFSSGNWSGDLSSFAIKDNGNIKENPSWKASQSIISPHNPKYEEYAPLRRNLFTMNSETGKGVRMEWHLLSEEQRQMLHRNVSGVHDGLGYQRLDFARGFSYLEQKNDGPFRDRVSALGDIINSDPFYVGQADYNFSLLPGEEGKSYTNFRNSNVYKNREGIVYVATNDGFLHGFSEGTGEEVFAYMPQSAYSRMSEFVSPRYIANHRYMNDGSPNVVDAYLNNQWKTVLLGSTGAGGRNFYFLDVTDPENFGPDNVISEFTSKDDPDLGFTIGQGTIIRAANGQWLAALPNGYNSKNGSAILFLVDINTGEVVKKINTGVSGDNGLSSILPIDINNDKITDYLYAGDLRGNMWKFDLTSNNSENWGVAMDGKPLFKTCSDNCVDPQPITSRPEAVLNTGSNQVSPGGQIILFGTGSYFAVDDNVVENARTESFYAIFDRNDGQTVNKNSLLKQDVIQESIFNPDNGTEPTAVRVTTERQMNQNNKGWYINLPNQGEKQVSGSIVRNGRVIFSTLIPNTEICQFGGTSWIMEIDIYTGARLDVVPFDLNQDLLFTNKDKVKVGDSLVNISGKRIKNGIIKTPAVVTNKDVEFKYASSTSGEIIKAVESGIDQEGREAWIQLR